MASGRTLARGTSREAIINVLAQPRPEQDVEKRLLQLESRIFILENLEKRRPSSPEPGSPVQPKINSANDSDVRDLKRELEKVRDLASASVQEAGGLAERAEEATRVKKRLSTIERCLSIPVEDDPTTQIINVTASLQQLLTSVQLLDQQVSKIQSQMPPLDSIHLLEQQVRELQSQRPPSDQEHVSHEPPSANHVPEAPPRDSIWDEEDKDTRRKSMISEAIHLPPAEDARKAIIHQLEYKFENSIWDLSLFIGTDILNRTTSAVVAICFILNVVLLICFIEACFSLAIPDFDDDTRQEFHVWRTTVAHNIDFRNSMTGESMTHGVCTEKIDTPVASFQLSTVIRLRDYLEDPPFLKFGIPKGVWMCWLSICVWYLTLTAELREIGELTSSFTGLPLDTHTRFVQYPPKPNKVCLVSVSPIRLSLLAVVVGIRFVVMVALGYEGTLFLVHEISPEDMILNSVALELMLNFDEMLFNALIPSVQQKVVKLVTPLDKKPSKRCFRLHKQWNQYGVFIAIVLTYIILFLFVHHFALHPFVNTLRDNLDALCGSEHLYDFVVTVDALGIPWAASTPSTRSIDTKYVSQAMEELLDYDINPMEWRLSPGQRRNTGLFMQVASGAILDRMRLELPEFEFPSTWTLVYPNEIGQVVGWEHEFQVFGSSLDFGDIPNTVFNSYLKFLLGSSGEVDCSHVPIERCFMQGGDPEEVVMKQLCPTRCGCDNPMGGTVANPFDEISPDGYLGCAKWNTRKAKFVETLEKLPCTDTTSADVFNTWAFGVGDATTRRKSGIRTYDLLVEQFRTGGCKEVATTRLINARESSRICAATSLAAICPESCGCNRSTPWTKDHAGDMGFCPYVCERNRPVCITIGEGVVNLTATGRGPFGGHACIFPYLYKGNTYNTCTSLDWSGPWCPVTLRQGMSYHWGDCANSTACLRDTPR